MTRLVFVLSLGLALAAGSSGSLAAQDTASDRAAAARATPERAAMDLHIASIESTRLAAQSLQNAIDIEAARRVAPFDFDWGTP